jgi:transposase
MKTLAPEQRLQGRQSRAVPIAKALHDWLIAQRTLLHDGTAEAKAIHFCVKRWVALTRYLNDPALPIDNNFDEQQIRPWTTGRKNWLFARNVERRQRPTAIMSLIQSAKLNGHDLCAYMKDELARLPTQPMRQIDDLLPHRWTPAR